MPELPEVETTARGLRQALVGRRIVDVGAIDWPPMLANVTASELRDRLPGLRVAEVGRRGKYLVVGLDGDCWLAIHRKMSGNLLLRPPHAPVERHTHLSLCFDPPARLDFIDPRKFGRVYLFPSRAAMAARFEAELGPDPIDDLTLEVLRDRLAARRGKLKSLLLNQQFLAGIGNLYADEILWAARIHPERQASTLTSREQRRLLDAIRQVLADAIERRGTSFSDYVDATGEPGANQFELRVYGRAGQPCFRCGTPITRLVIGQRGTWLCRRCQRAPRPTSGRGPRR